MYSPAIVVKICMMYTLDGSIVVAPDNPIRMLHADWLLTPEWMDI